MFLKDRLCVPSSPARTTTIKNKLKKKKIHKVDLLYRWGVRTSDILVWGKNLWVQSYGVIFSVGFWIKWHLKAHILRGKKNIHSFLCFCTHRGHQSSCCGINTNKLSGTSHIFLMGAYLAKQSVNNCHLLSTEMHEVQFHIAVCRQQQSGFLYYGSGFTHFCSLP